MYSLPLLQAINDWQRGGDAKQKKKRGQALKNVAGQLEPQFRRAALVCFRQVALDKGHLWKLGDRLHLEETISAWTYSTEIAKSFKGGVPPEGQGYQGVIFEHTPDPGEVIVNLQAVYQDPNFKSAYEAHRHDIAGFADGIGKYGDKQAEVVLDVSDLPISAIYAFGGHSHSRERIARMLFDHDPSESELAAFDELLLKSGRTLGPHWVTGDVKDRVSDKMLKSVEKLRPYHP